MTCREFEGALVEGGADLRRLQDHAAACAPCAEALRRHERLLAALACAAPPPPPAGLASRVRRRIEQEGLRPGPAPRTSFIPFAAAAAVLLLAAGVYFLAARGGAPPAGRPALSLVPEPGSASALRIGRTGSPASGEALAPGTVVEHAGGAGAEGVPAGLLLARGGLPDGRLDVFPGTRLKTAERGLFLEKGIVGVSVPPGRGDYAVLFPGGAVRVKGTRFVVHFLPGQEVGVAVLSGAVVFEQGDAVREVRAGFRSAAAIGRAPREPEPLFAQGNADPSALPEAERNRALDDAGAKFPEPYRELVVQYLKAMEGK